MADEESKTYGAACKPPGHPRWLSYPKDTSGVGPILQEFPTANSIGPSDVPALMEALRKEGAADKLLEGLRMEFLVCVTSGRLDEWAAAAHATIEVIANCGTPRPKRRQPH